MPKAVEEEVVIGGQGEQQIVVKAGPKKPKLENLTLSQWSVANLAILYKLVEDGKLKDEALMDNLSYSTKIYQLVQKCSLASVQLYGREPELECWARALGFSCQHSTPVMDFISHIPSNFIMIIIQLAAYCTIFC